MKRCTRLLLIASVFVFFPGQFEDCAESTELHE